MIFKESSFQTRNINHLKEIHAALQCKECFASTPSIYGRKFLAEMVTCKEFSRWRKRVRKSTIKRAEKYAKDLDFTRK